MNEIKIGIIVCDRYRNCGGVKCFRALQNREGAFDIYSKDEPLELVGYATCVGCPGGNIEYVPEEMKNNGAEVIHFATGFIVGYPPCPYIRHFQDLIREKFDMKVIVGTHPLSLQRPLRMIDKYLACLIPKEILLFPYHIPRL